MIDDEPVWLTYRAVVAFQLDQLREHGGRQGIRDENALRSALDRPRHAYAYGDERDLCALAASYAFGLSRNHPFNDGNKRTAYVAMGTFLLRNGLELNADELNAAQTMWALAAGDLSEAELVEWTRQNTVPIGE